MTIFNMSTGNVSVLSNVAVSSTALGFLVTWDAQNANESVEVLISGNAYISGAIGVVSTIDTSYTQTNLPVNTYYVFARRVNQYGIFSPWDVADGSGHSVFVGGVYPTNLGTTNVSTLNGGAWALVESFANVTPAYGADPYGYALVGWNANNVQTHFTSGFNQVNTSGVSYNTIHCTSFSETAPPVSTGAFMGNLGLHPAVTSYANGAPYTSNVSIYEGGGVLASLDPTAPTVYFIVSPDQFSFTGGNANIKLPIDFEVDYGMILPAGSETILSLHQGNTVVGTKTFAIAGAAGFGWDGNATTTPLSIPNTVHSVSLPAGSRFDDFTPIQFDGTSGNVYYLTLSTKPVSYLQVRRAFIRYSYSD